MIFTDQMGHTFELDGFPKKIISVVPSQTELLHDLGLEDRVVGITKFCIHPKGWLRKKVRVGGTKNINLAKIAALKPDLIIANKEENTQKEIEELQKIYPVYTSDIANLEQSLIMIKDIGILTDTQEKARVIVDHIQTGFKELAKHNFKIKTTLYLIWKNPYMSVNQHRFIHDMMSRCGYVNVIKSPENYPEISDAEIKRLDPEFILLSSEPYPFNEKHIKELQNIEKNTKIMLVDGEYFSWYGSRLLGASEYFLSLRS